MLYEKKLSLPWEFEFPTGWDRGRSQDRSWAGAAALSRLLLAPKPPWRRHEEVPEEGTPTKQFFPTLGMTLFAFYDERVDLGTGAGGGL